MRNGRQQDESYIFTNTNDRISLVSIRHGVYSIELVNLSARTFTGEPNLTTYVRGSREKLKRDIKEAFVLD